MARDFLDTSNQYLTNGNGIIGDPPFTFAAWLYPNDIATWQVFMDSTDSAGVFYSAHLAIVGTGDDLQFAYRGSDAGKNTLINTGDLSASAWNHCCGVAQTDSTAHVYVNGGNKQTTSSGTYDGFSNNNDTFGLGARYQTGSWAAYLDGNLAECAIWNTNLSDAEVAILAAGYSPLLVRPQSLIVYWPLIGRMSPEIDLVGGFDMTLGNAPTTAAHPPVLYAKKQHIYGDGTLPTDVSGKVLASLFPTAYIPNTSNYATLSLRNNRPVFEFDASTSESAYFRGVIPQQYEDNGISVNVFYTINTAVTGEVRFGAQFEKVDIDLDDDSFATARYLNQIVPTVDGQLKVARIRFTNTEIDGLSAGDAFRLKIIRDAVYDSAGNDAQIHWVELRET